MSSKANIKISLIMIVIFIVSSIAITVSYYTINNIPTKSDTSPTTPLQDWNNENEIELKKVIEGQWNWRYENNGRKFVQICSRWNHDASFIADDQLVSTYDNKIVTGLETSYLRDYKGDKIYEVNTGDIWQALINNNRISVKYLVKKVENDEVVAYVSGTSFFEDNFSFKNPDGDEMVSISRDKISTQWVWKYKQDPTKNTLPLSLVVSISSRISFMGKDTDLCNSTWQTLFIFMIISWVFLGLSLINLLYCLFIYFRGSNNSISNTTNVSIV